MRYLLHFLWKNYSFFLFLILEFIALAIVVNGNKHQSAVFSSIANQYGGKIFASYSNMRNYFHLKEANKQLSAENIILREQIQKLEFAKDTNNLQAFEDISTKNIVLEDTSKPLYDFISAKVISNSTNRQKNYIMLNKGRRQGVRENMGLIGPNGIVGVVYETSEDFSTAISLLNIKLRVSAKLKKNNELGTFMWDGVSAQYGQLDAVENYVHVMVGDTVVTSGFSHIFPEGEIIGTIEKVSEIPGRTSWNIQVKFGTDFSKLYWVSVVRNLNYKQQMALKAIELEN